MIAPVVVVTLPEAPITAAPVIETSPAVVTILPSLPKLTTLAFKVTPPVEATAPLAVIAPRTTRVSKFVPTFKLADGVGLFVNKSTARVVTVSLPELPRIEIPEKVPTPGVLFAAV